MIRTQDLRLGNLIKFKALNPDDEEIEYRGEVTAIRKDSVTMNDHLHIPQQFILPVSLTKDQFTKLGFQMIAGSYTFSGFYVFPFEAGEYILELEGQGYGKTFHYVHELQNLYFSICGNELTLN